MQATVHFDPKIHQAIKIRAAQSGKTISSVIEDMARQYLLEDQEDIQSFKDRKDEPVLSYEAFLSQLSLKTE